MSSAYDFLPEISDSESSSTSSSSEEETSEVSMKVERIDESTKHNINNTPKSVRNPEKLLRLSKKMLSEWTVDDLLQLVDRMKGTLPENDSTKFSKQVKKIVWDNIAFNDHSGSDCSSAWSAIQRGIRKDRILKEVLSDAEQAISKIPKSTNKNPKSRHPEQPKRPLSAYLIFCSAKKEEVYRENPGMKNTDRMKLIGAMFNNLSVDNRKIYTNREEELKKIYNEQLQQFYIKNPKQVKQKTPSPTNKPKTPFQMYYEEQIKSVSTSLESESFSKMQYKEKWKNIDKDEKIVFINLAVENERKFIKELEDFEEKPKYKSILSKEERLLRETQAGKPKKPPHSAYGLFTQVELKKDEMKKFDIKERMQLVGSRWNNCPQEIKAKLICETSELKEKYKSDYNDYLRSLPEELRQEELKTKSKKRKLSLKESEIQKRRKIGLPERNNLVKPERPPSAPELFAQMHPENNINFELAWINLSKTEKRRYKRKVSLLHTKYLADFDAYVKATIENQQSKASTSASTASTSSEEDVESTISPSSSKESVPDNLDIESENEHSDSEDGCSNLSDLEESGSDKKDSSDSDSN